LINFDRKYFLELFRISKIIRSNSQTAVIAPAFHLTVACTRRWAEPNRGEAQCGWSGAPQRRGTPTSPRILTRSAYRLVSCWISPLHLISVSCHTYIIAARFLYFCDFVRLLSWRESSEVCPFSRLLYFALRSRFNPYFVKRC